MQQNLHGRQLSIVELLHNANSTLLFTLNHAHFLPCFQIAEFLGDYFPQVNAQSIDNSLGKIWMRCTTENFDIWHSTPEKRTRLF